MKKYGQAEYMIDLVRLFIEYHDKLTADQKTKIENRCCTEITSKYPTAAERMTER